MLTGCVSDVASVSDMGQTGRGRKLAGTGGGGGGGAGKTARQLSGRSLTVEAFAVRGNLKRWSQLQEELKWVSFDG